MMKKVAEIRCSTAGDTWSYPIAVDIQGYLVRSCWARSSAITLSSTSRAHGHDGHGFYVTPDKKACFAEVYHWDREQNKPVMASPVGSRQLRKPMGSSRGEAASGIDPRLRALLPDASREGRIRRSANLEAGVVALRTENTHRKSAGVG